MNEYKGLEYNSGLRRHSLIASSSITIGGITLIYKPCKECGTLTENFDSICWKCQWICYNCSICKKDYFSRKFIINKNICYLCYIQSQLHDHYIDHHLLKPFHPLRKIILLDAFIKFHLKYKN
jgi:hypothetical protein